MEYISRVHSVFVHGKFVEGLRYCCGELADATNQHWDVRESCAPTSQVYNLLAKSFLDFLGWRGQWCFLYVFLFENIDISNIINIIDIYIYIKHYHTLSILYRYMICVHNMYSCQLGLRYSCRASWEVPGWHVERAFRIGQRQVLHRLQAGAHEPIFINDTYYWSFYRSKPYETPLYDTIIWVGSTSINLSHYDNMNRRGFHEFVHTATLVDQKMSVATCALVVRFPVLIRQQN